MPIAKDEWEKGRKAGTIDSRVFTFLKSHPEMAYTQGEIIENLIKTKISDTSDFIRGFVLATTVNEALKKLVKEGHVKAKAVQLEVGVDTYYTVV